MKTGHPVKITFFILALLLVVAAVFLAVQYPKLKQPRTAGKQTPGVCSPNSAACQGNPKLCMDLNENLVCN